MVHSDMTTKGKEGTIAKTPLKKLGLHWRENE